jgi:membrane-associated HD superfamily phosphohydrolase
MKARTNFFQVFRLIHMAQVLGVTIFGIAAIVIVRKRLQAPVDTSVDRTLQVIVVVISGLMLFFGFKLFKNRILQIRESRDVVQKRIDDYRGACILWWIMTTVPALLSFACFILTANYAFFALGIFHLMILIMFSPRRDNIILLLNVSNQELQEING